MDIVTIHLIRIFGDYPLKDVLNFATVGGHSLLWPEATTFLSHRGAYSRPEAATVACGRRPQGFISQMSRLKSGHLVTLVIINVGTDIVISLYFYKIIRID